jgi:hypothetical protein
VFYVYDYDSNTKSIRIQNLLFYIMYKPHFVMESGEKKGQGELPNVQELRSMVMIRLFACFLSHFFPLWWSCAGLNKRLEAFELNFAACARSLLPPNQFDAVGGCRSSRDVATHHSLLDLQHGPFARNQACYVVLPDALY